MGDGRTIKGIELDRVVLRAAALRIIRTVLEKPIAEPKYRVRKDWLASPRLEAFRRLEPIGFEADGYKDQAIRLVAL